MRNDGISFTTTVPHPASQHTQQRQKAELPGLLNHSDGGLTRDLQQLRAIKGELLEFKCNTDVQPVLRVLDEVLGRAYRGIPIDIRTLDALIQAAYEVNP